MTVLQPGLQIGNYEIIRPLGRGGMAVVALAKHRTLGTRVALKLLHIASDGVVKRLLKEGQLQATIQHDNVVEVIDVLRVDGLPCLVMEFVDGPSLGSAMAHHPLRLDHIDDIACQLFDGLEAAHSSPMVHRDLKPQNILLALEPGRVTVKIADFGLAKARSDVDIELGRHTTRSGQMLGTPAYMAPEQFEDAKSVAEQADLFSVGAILYEVLTGRTPYGADSLVAIHARIINGQYEPIRAYRPDCPERIVRAIDAALQPEAQDRVRSVTELRRLWLDDTELVETPWSQHDIEQLSLARDAEHKHTAATPAEFVGPVTPAPETLDVGSFTSVSPSSSTSHRPFILVAAATALAVTVLWSGVLMGILVATGVVSTGAEAAPAPVMALDADLATIRVHGDVPTYLVGSDGSRYAPGEPLPSDTYAVWASFTSNSPVRTLMVDVRDGVQVDVACDAGSALCSVN